MTAARRLRVIKLSGSLFDMPHLHSRLSHWSARQTAALSVWISGGGEFVESLRRWQSTHGMDDQRAHLAAIDLMSFTVKLVQSWWPHWPIWVDLAELRVWIDETLPPRTSDTSPVAALFDCRQWLATREDLPRSWTVTSDSIAAALASELEADELVLLKSVVPSAEIERDALSSTGVVDPYFEIAAQSVPNIRIVNLRTDHDDEWTSAPIKPRQVP
ncbi:MAG TPA: hypothetical protein PKD54_00710 [Pirellulaceae bacterium]|nr:hypothetical protein [Pirellulaceae bacterium]